MLTHRTDNGMADPNQVSMGYLRGFPAIQKKTTRGKGNFVLASTHY